MKQTQQILDYVRDALTRGATIKATDATKPVLQPMADGSCNGNLTITFSPVSK